MAKATIASLTKREQALVAATQRDNLARLDEDGLADLLTRVRRERDKAVQLHRREVGEQVSASGGRGAVSAAPRRSASKAEIFEQALARVSAALAKAARQSAAELRAERLAAAERPRTGKPTAPAAKGRAAKQPAAPTPRSRARKPVEQKVAASTQGHGRPPPGQARRPLKPATPTASCGSTAR